MRKSLFKHDNSHSYSVSSAHPTPQFRRAVEHINKCFLEDSKDILTQYLIPDHNIVGRVSTSGAKELAVAVVAPSRVGLVESSGWCWWSAFTAICDLLDVAGLLTVFCYCCTARWSHRIAVDGDCRGLFHYRFLLCLSLLRFIQFLQLEFFDNCCSDLSVWFFEHFLLYCVVLSVALWKILIWLLCFWLFWCLVPNFWI